MEAVGKLKVVGAAGAVTTGAANELCTAARALPAAGWLSHHHVRVGLGLRERVGVGVGVGVCVCAPMGPPMQIRVRGSLYWNNFSPGMRPLRHTAFSFSHQLPNQFRRIPKLNLLRA